MAVGVTWSPEMARLRYEWSTVADRFAGEAEHRIEEAAQGAAVAIRTAYARHWVTGALASRVAARRSTRGALAPAWKIYSNAPHTWLFEHGSRPRSYVSKRGKVHNTGAMWHGSPPAPTFYPTVNKFRRALELDLIDMMRRSGVPGLVSVTEEGV
jgi:hypothetical protein